eukprot:snap_masked-scaffold_17-processed-gene-0.10-mRNA-1 protein AED:0.06 eAED:0.09 QI:0/-1/0/1/-1/1/1/0/505
MSLNSDELNLLILRYLEECNFTHSSFTFLNESMLSKSSLTEHNLPPNSLINLVQRGILYTEIEQDQTKKPSSQPIKRKNIQSKPVNQKKKKKKRKQLESFILSTKENEALTSQWNPKKPNLLLSGLGKAKAILWNLSKNTENKETQSLNLSFDSPLLSRKKKQLFDVTSVQWSNDGNLLVIGDSQGFLTLWKLDGNELKKLCAFRAHKSCVFAAKFNFSSSLLVSASNDKTLCLYNVKELINNKEKNIYEEVLEDIVEKVIAISGEVVKKGLKQVIRIHEAAVLDICWKPTKEDIFASSSADKTVGIYNVSLQKNIIIRGHGGEVNAVRYSPCGNILASAAEDKTTKLWLVNINKEEQPVTTLMGHNEEVFSLNWAPKGIERENILENRLGTTSFDCTVRLWKVLYDKETKTIQAHSLFVLREHKGPVYSVCFSPNEEQWPYVASGGIDKNVHIYDSQTGGLLYKHTTLGTVYEMTFGIVDDKLLLAASCGRGENHVNVITLPKE